jgi:hypothetical protein
MQECGRGSAPLSDECSPFGIKPLVHAQTFAGKAEDSGVNAEGYGKIAQAVQEFRCIAGAGGKFQAETQPESPCTGGPFAENSPLRGARGVFAFHNENCCLSGVAHTVSLLYTRKPKYIQPKPNWPRDTGMFRGRLKINDFLLPIPKNTKRFLRALRVFRGSRKGCNALNVVLGRFLTPSSVL